MENKKEKPDYTKPIIVAENNENGSFAAGCPPQNSCPSGHSTGDYICKKCERSK